MAKEAAIRRCGLAAEWPQRTVQRALPRCDRASQCGHRHRVACSTAGGAGSGCAASAASMGAGSPARLGQLGAGPQTGPGPSPQCLGTCAIQAPMLDVSAAHPTAVCGQSGACEPAPPGCTAPAATTAAKGTAGTATCAARCPPCTAGRATAGDMGRWVLAAG